MSESPPLIGLLHGEQIFQQAFFDLLIFLLGGVDLFLARLFVRGKLTPDRKGLVLALFLAISVLLVFMMRTLP